MFLKFGHLFLIITLLFNMPYSFAQRVNTVNINELVAEAYDNFHDISYVNLMPQYTNNINPAHATSMDVFSGNFDENQSNNAQVQWIRNFLLQEKTENPNVKFQITGLSLPDEDLSTDRGVRELISDIRMEGTRVSFEKIPDGLHISHNRHADTTLVTPKKDKRIPSSLSQRVKWTLIRGAANGLGTTISFYIGKDVDVNTSLIMGLITGLASGSLTYFSTAYTEYMTNGRFIRWFMESNDKVATALRRTFNLNLENFAQYMQREERAFKAHYPGLSAHEFQDIIDSCARQSMNMSRERRARILPKLLKVEEMLKWWITDAFFYLIVGIIPQGLTGITAFTGVTNTLVASGISGAIGFASQGPGELGIFARKRSMIEQLREDVRLNRVHYEDSHVLLAEIERVLATSGEHASYIIHDRSHPALIRIENWTRTRMTLMSFFAVTGVIMETAQVPLATPYLISVASGGAFYYLKANNLYNIDNRLQRLGDNLANIRRRLSPLQNYFTRLCSSAFRKK